MGERINFPKNYDWYLKSAIHKFQEGNMEEACRYFEEAYAIKQEAGVNTMYVSALFQLEDYEKAKEIADEKKSVYENEETLYSLYTTILIKNHLFVEAERIIQKKLMQQKSSSTKEIWVATKNALALEKVKKGQDHKKKNQELVKEILAMGDKTFEHQAALVKQMKEMDTEWYQLGARNILQNPFVNEIVKSTVLESLIGQKVDEEFELYWFDQRRFIVPAQQTSLEQKAIVQEVIQLLKGKFEEDNPSLYHTLLQEVNLHFLLLHPFIEEVITDANKWLTVCFEPYDLRFKHPIEEDKESQQMKTWIQRLNEEIENMMF